MKSKYAALMVILTLAGAQTVWAQDSEAESKPVEQASTELFCSGDEAMDGAKLLAAIASARVLMQVDGDLPEAQILLDTTWLNALTNRPFAQQREVLVEVALARSELFSMRGKVDQARLAASQLLLARADMEHLIVPVAELRAPTVELRKLVSAAQEDERLAERLLELAKANQRDDLASLEDIVREAFENRQFRTIIEIGTPAQRPFAELIVANADDFPEQANWDPLDELLRMNRRLSAEILLENLNAGGYLWKRRILRAMKHQRVLKDGSAWSSSAPYVCLEPEWLRVIEALLSSPDTALQSVPLAIEPYLRDHLTPGLQRALVHGIEHYGIDFTNAVLLAFDRGGVVESAKSVFEAAAKHPAPQVKRFAARMLANYPSSDVLKSLAADADPEIRYSVVGTLQPHSCLEVIPDGNGSTKSYRFERTPSIGEDERKLLTTFSDDPDPRIRERVVRALSSLDVPLADEVYTKLAADPDPEVRGDLAWRVANAKLNDELRSRVLATLASDDDDEVRDLVDQALSEAPIASAPTPFLEAIRVRLSDAQHPMEDYGPHVAGLLFNTREGREAMASWVITLDRPLTRRLYFTELQRGSYGHLLQLDDPTLAAVFALTQNLQGSQARNHRQGSNHAISNARPPRYAAMRLALANEENNTAIRLTAAQLAAPGGGAELGKGLAALIRDDHWKHTAPASEDEELLNSAVSRVPDDERNALILSIVNDDAASETLARSIASQYSPAAQLGPEITAKVIERWFSPQGQYYEAVATAVQSLAALPDPPSVQFMEAAVRNHNYAEAAVQTMAALRRPEYLPTLERCMTGDWISRKSTRRDVRREAASAVAGYLTEAAAEVLVRGLGSSDQQIRSTCSIGLGTLQSMRAEQERWSTTKVVKPTKASALEELLGMLDHKNAEIRVQAVRGIATFGAIEYLPTLIRLLEDPNKEVVEAARRSIDILSLDPK